KGLHAEALGIGVAAVTSRTATFGLGHSFSLGLGRNLGDLDGRVVLAVAPTAALDGLRLVGQGTNLRALLTTNDLRGHRGTLQGRSGGDLVTIDEQNGLKLNIGTNFLRSQVN